MTHIRHFRQRFSRCKDIAHTYVANYASDTFTFVCLEYCTRIITIRHLRGSYITNYASCLRIIVTSGTYTAK